MKHPTVIANPLVDAVHRALDNSTATPSKLLESVHAVALQQVVTKRDGRLRAIISRGELEIKAAYPGNWKQSLTSRTIRTAIDKLIWERVEHRVRRFFAKPK